MVAITQNQLQRVRSGLKFQDGLGLPLAKMDLLRIFRDRLGQFRQLRIDQQVMVTRIFKAVTRWGNGHSADSELDFYRGCYRVTIRWADDKNGGPGR